MTTVFVGIDGPGTAEDLENGGREAIARAGYQVGSFQIEQDMTSDNDGIVGNMEVEERFWRDAEAEDGLECSWNGYTVTVTIA